MSTSGELEAAVAKAEVDWGKAFLAFEKAQAERDKANAAWDIYRVLLLCGLAGIPADKLALADAGIAGVVLSCLRPVH
jgi:hypothetical protein